MKKSVIIISMALMTTIAICSLTACKNKKLPELESVLKYSDEELNKLAANIDEQTLSDNWGKPETVNYRRIWRVPFDGKTKFVVAYVENGKVINLDVSYNLFVTVVAVNNGTAYCLTGWDDYSRDAGSLTFMPNRDMFGNEITCKVGDLFTFEFEGMIMESYPAQLTPPYSATLRGHLTDEDTKALNEKIVLP